jgi:hypothetical protein
LAIHFEVNVILYLINNEKNAYHMLEFTFACERSRPCLFLYFKLPPSTFHLPPVLEDSYALLMDRGESNDESLVRDIEE